MSRPTNPYESRKRGREHFAVGIHRPVNEPNRGFASGWFHSSSRITGKPEVIVVPKSVSGKFHHIGNDKR
jgi:hypothetical protein